MFQILTLVSAKDGLTSSIVAEATAALNKIARQIGNITWLSPGEALDITFECASAIVAEMEKEIAPAVQQPLLALRGASAGAGTPYQASN